MYEVLIHNEQLNKLASIIKEGWYMHFWNGNHIYALFRNKLFELDYDERSTWKDVLEYGQKLGIPEKELDFSI